MALKQNAYVDDLLAECFAYFEQGLCCDEDGDKEDACYFYERGLNILKLTEEQKECKSNDKFKSMDETRKTIEARLKALKKVCTTKEDEKFKGSSKQNLMNEMREQLRTTIFPEAELVFIIPNGVQLFMVEDGAATVPTMPSSLEIFKLPKQKGSSESRSPDAFLKVGPWTYPLKSGSIPILKNEFGAYVMPNPIPDHPNLFVALLLPGNLGNKVENEFVKILKEYAEVRDQEVSKELSQEENKRLSERIASLLVKGGENIAWGVSYAAEKTNAIVTERTSKFRSSLTPNEQPLKVNPLVRTGVYCVHGGSKVIAKCTRYLLDKIGDMGIAVGQTLATGAEKTFGDGKNRGLVNGTITVLAGGITGVSTVWIALENASKILCKNIANETVETVKQKYGDEASMTTHKALYATGHTTLAALQLYDLGPRAIAGRAARKAGIHFIKGLHETHSTSDLKAKKE